MDAQLPQAVTVQDCYLAAIYDRLGTILQILQPEAKAETAPPEQITLIETAPEVVTPAPSEGPAPKKVPPKAQPRRR